MQTISVIRHKSGFVAALVAVFVLSITASHPARADLTYCTEKFNRAQSMMGNGEAWMCANQQQFLGAIDEAQRACAGFDNGVNWNDIRTQFRAGAAGCAAKYGATNAGSGVATSGSGIVQGGNIDQSRRDRSRADQFLDDIKQCDARADREACRKQVFENYQGSGGGVVGNGINSGNGMAASGNTSGGGSSSPDAPDKPPSPPPFTPKDPGTDFTGQSCAYFTRPAVEADGARLNYYAKGSCVVYGDTAYECDDNGRWLRKGPAHVFRCQRAEDIEGTASANAPGN